jgi:hypothetical protein
MPVVTPVSNFGAYWKTPRDILFIHIWILFALSLSVAIIGSGRKVIAPLRVDIGHRTAVLEATKESEEKRMQNVPAPTVDAVDEIYIK